MNDQATTTPFDADAFMQSTVDAPLETEYARCPAGTYQAMIDDFTSEALSVFDFTYQRGPNAGQPGNMLKFTLPFVIQDARVQAEMGRDRVVVDKQMILDRDDGGRIATGKNRNIELGRVRLAAGQQSLANWGIQNLRGAGPVMVKVVHNQYKRKDGTMGTRVEVTDVAPIR